MGNRKRPFLVTGAAVASAAAIVAASPTLVPSQDLVSGSARSVSANYELMALSDITIEGISNAYWNGWGNYIGACCKTNGDPFDPSVLYPANADGSAPYVSDPYYPELNGPVAYYPAGADKPSGYYYDQNPIYLTGAAGVLYYLVDTTLYGTVDTDLYNYYFEVGWLNGGNPNAAYSGVGAVIYVGLSQAFGQDSAIGQLANTIFHVGVTTTLQSAAVSLATVLVPAVDIGPVKVGAGNLAGLYFFGVTPTGTYNYGTPGLSAILGYISTSIAGNIPSSAAVPAAGATATLAAASETAPESSAASDSLVSAASAAADSATPKAAVGGSKTASSAADSADAKDAPAATDAPAGIKDAAESSDSAGSAGGHSASAKPGKTRAENPLSKITTKVRSALGGAKKSAGSDSSSSSDSASASKGDS